MTEHNRRAVVTGGAGFIGSHLVDALLEDGFEVAVIDNLSAGRTDLINKNAHFYNKDVRNYDDIAPIISGAEVVFHLAALPRVQDSIDDPEGTNDVNVVGTLVVLRAAKDGGVRRVVNSSSSAVYGENPTLPLKEDFIARPVTPYGLQKFMSEEYARLYAEIYHLETVSLRYFNAYGPRLDPNGAYALVVGKFLKMKKEGKPLTVTGDGTQTRDFVHVADIVRANILASKSDRVGMGEGINIGSGERISMNTLAQRFGGPIEYISARKESPHTLADNRKAKELLGWEPTIRIEEGIALLCREWGV